jgi:hypothetical protein
MLAGSVPALAASREPVCDVLHYGATGKGVALDSPAINAAIADCSAKGGGRVVLKRGTYRSGTIRLQSNVTLDLKSGSKILGSSNLADYSHMSSKSEWRDTPLLVAENVHDIAIIGKGTIDGNGRAFVDPAGPHWKPSFDVSLTRQGNAWAARMAQSNEGPFSMLLRPGVLFVALHVDGLVLRDFHVVDTPNWGIKVGCSKFVDVHHIDVRSNVFIPNDDALEISSSQYVNVSDSCLEAGDDALVIGGPCTDGWCQDKAEHITVHDMTLVSRSAAIRVGPSAKGISDAHFYRIKIKDSNRGILLQTRDDETPEDVTFEQMHIQTRLIDGPWWGGGEPIAISVAHGDYVSWTPTTQLGFLRNIRFSDIVIDTESPVVIYSTQPGHIQNLSFKNVFITMHVGPLTSVLGGNLDLQPTTPEIGVRAQDLPAILVHQVDGLSFTNLTVNWKGTFPTFYTNALFAEGFNGLTVDNFHGSAAQSNLPAIHLGLGTGAQLTDIHNPDGSLSK